MIKILLAIVLSMIGNYLFASEEKANEVDFVSLCKKECPGTKKNKEVFECAEAKENEAEFKKSKCGIEYAKFEAANGGHKHSGDHKGHAH